MVKIIRPPECLLKVDLSFSIFYLYNTNLEANFYVRFCLCVHVDIHIHIITVGQNALNVYAIYQIRYNVIFDIIHVCNNFDGIFQLVHRGSECPVSVQ